jgi:hypothetical protein
MCKCSNKVEQCIGLTGMRPRIGCVINVFLTKLGMIGKDRDTGRRVKYVPGSTNVWQEVQL